MSSSSTDSDLCLGFDLSTQQLKIISCYSNLKFHSKYSINFDDFKDEFGISKGVLSNNDTGEIVTPVKVFIKALQCLMDRMKQDNFPFNNVISISGSCQQHGTVYYNDKITELLEDLDPNSSNWDKDLASGFSFLNASNWQDRSTAQEINDFENSVGGAFNLCFKTGSKAHYRFSGPQMRRRARENNDHWKQTSNINLISSFLDTFLTGSLSGIEIGEACGTNLFNIIENDWDDDLLSLIVMKNSKIDNVSKDEQSEGARTARKMLGKVVLPNEFKTIAPYLSKRYGFNSSCKIWPITGDNLATIMSLPLKRDDLLVSMGTSTTVLLLTKKYLPSVNYHLFRHPVCPELFMSMLCYCNGALAREQIRDEINEKYETQGWTKFNDLLESEHNTDKVGIYFPLGEIIPNAKSQKRRFKYDGKELIEIGNANIDIDDDALLIIESQALSNRLRVCPMLSDDSVDLNETTKTALSKLSQIVGEKLTIDNVSYDGSEFIKRPNSVYYVGGSSKNDSILKVYNKILAPKEAGYKVEIGDACALGGCFRSIWGSSVTDLGFEDWITEKFDREGNLDKLEGDVTVKDWAEYIEKMGILSLAEDKMV